MNTIDIKAASPEERRANLAYLKALGYRWQSIDWTPEQMDSERPFDDYFSVLAITSGGRILIGGNDGVPLSEAIPILHKLPRQESIRLNSEYIAEVTKDGIKVGGQTFPHSIVSELAEAIKKVTA